MSEVGSENLHFWQFPGNAAGLLPADAPRDHTLRTIALGNEKLLKGFKPRNNTVRVAFSLPKVSMESIQQYQGKKPSIFKINKNVAALF